MQPGFFKKVMKDYNKMYEFNFNKTQIYFIVSYHMQMRIHIYDNTNQYNRV